MEGELDKWNSLTESRRTVPQNQVVLEIEERVTLDMVEDHCKNRRKWTVKEEKHGGRAEL